MHLHDSELSETLGVTLASERRHQLVEMADEYDLLIIEDDAYFDLFFESDAARWFRLRRFGPSEWFVSGLFQRCLRPEFEPPTCERPRRLRRKSSVPRRAPISRRACLIRR